MIVVVDTNVPIVANGGSEQASPDCVLACVQQIQQITQAGKLVLDDRWYIIREYMNNLHSEGQPGVGDAFLNWVLQNMTNRERCELVPITPLEPDNRNCTDFAEFPNDPALTGFDPSDRKFVAVAIAHVEHPPILEAVDFKWWNFKNVLFAHGVKVEFLCQKEMQHD